MRAVAAAQGLYYLATGLWPLLSARSFQRVTGPKKDLWLVKTMGALVAGAGVLIAAGAARKTLPRDASRLAVLFAGVLGGAEAYYAARRVISKVYGLDAVLEAAFLLRRIMASK